MLSHARGNPDTEVGRTLSARSQVGYPPENGKGSRRRSGGQTRPKYSETGEPITRRRGEQGYPACKGTRGRTCRVDGYYDPPKNIASPPKPTPLPISDHLQQQHKDTNQNTESTFPRPQNPSRRKLDIDFQATLYWRHHLTLPKQCYTEVRTAAAAQRGRDGQIPIRLPRA